ncbi:MAG: TonB-dependent receptor [Ginsengibacter sp.]
MKYLLTITLIFITISFSLTVQAQRKQERFFLSGSVTDTSGSPLAGASVYIADLKKGSVADANGYFNISNIPGGTYVVEVKFIGYKTIAENLDINKNLTENFRMELSVVEENAIVITGTSRATSIIRNPVPIVAVNKQFMEQNLNTNVIDAIATVPGISEVTTGPNVSKPFIRGLGFNRILTLYDGVRLEGQQWGDEHGIEVDENTVDRVEVVKGPASLIYGSDALAGVVNLIPVQPPSEGKIVGNILNDYQSNNRLIENSATIAGHTNDWIWGGTFTHKIATNYKDKYDGRVYNTGFAETDASANVGINKNWGYSHFGFAMYNDLQEIPDGSRDSATRKFTKQISEADNYRPIVSNAELNSYKISALHQHVQHYNFYSANSFDLGSGRLAVNLAFQKSIRREYSHPEVQVPGLYLLLNTSTYDAKYYFNERNGFSVTAGVNGMYQDNKVTKGTEYIIPSYQQFDAGPFVFITKRMEKLEVSGGVRYDVRDYHNNDLYANTNPLSGFDHVVSGKDTVGAEHLFNSYHHTFSGMSGSIGVSYKFNKKVSAKANIGRGYRAPNVYEISANGVHPGTNIYQIGHLNFKPEFSLQEDLGVRFNSTHVTVDADVFNNQIQNYIYNQKLTTATGQDSVIVPGNETFKFVAARAQLYGGELSVDVHPHPWDWLHFENSLSVVYGLNKGVPGEGKISDSAKYLPFIPPLHTISELRANIKKAGSVFANAFVKVQFEVYAAQNRAYLENNTETPTPGYQLFNAGFGTDIMNRNGRAMFNISLLGNNLFNVAYQSGLNRLKYFEPYPGNFTGHDGIYNMGRNFSIKVNVPLRLKAEE